ncbi:unnamed protein product [Parajaminaea phylloscopi]
MTAFALAASPAYRSGAALIARNGLRQLSISHPARNMNAKGPWADAPSASSTSTVGHYVVLAEDREDGGLARRLAVRQQHLDQARAGKESGRILLGGGLLGVDHADVGSEGAAQHLKGSLLVVRGESIEDVRARLAQDPYMTNDVFDPAKVRIMPILLASLSPSADQAAATVAVEQTAEEAATFPSLSALREEEMGRWKDRAVKSLAWLREGGANRRLA